MAEKVCDCRYGRCGAANLLWNYVDYFSDKYIADYINAVEQKRGAVYKGLTHEEVLIKMRALVEEKQMTLFGLLAFSEKEHLQDLTAPTVNIAITQYAGVDKVNPTDTSEVSLDDREFDGNVVDQFEDALKFVLSKLSVRSRIESTGRRRDYLAIPNVALREVLANAIVHRDYTTMRGRIQIDIYADRIEFANPGRSLVPLDQIETTYSQTRNPLLMNYLKDLNVTEHRGRGIRTIKYSLREAGLALPKFEHRYDWFVATLYSTAFISDDDQSWLQKFKSYRLNDRQRSALVHIRHNPEGIGNSEYRSINNMSSVRDDIRAKKELVAMVNFGLLQKTGAQRNRRYVLMSDNG